MTQQEQDRRRLLEIIGDSCLSAECQAVYSREHESCAAERAEAIRLVEQLADQAIWAARAREVLGRDPFLLSGWKSDRISAINSLLGDYDRLEKT